MIEIKDLLLKFSHLLTSGEAQKETIRSIISEAIGIQIKSEDIKIKKQQ